MRKTLTALSIAAAFAVSVPALAQSTGNSDNGGFFVNGNAGHAQVISGPNSGSDTGYAINDCYRWPLSPNFALRAEVGHHDLGHQQIKNEFNNQPVVEDDKN